MDVRKKAGSKEARRETRHANTRGTETGHKTQRGYTQRKKARRRADVLSQRGGDARRRRDNTWLRTCVARGCERGGRGINGRRSAPGKVCKWSLVRVKRAAAWRRHCFGVRRRGIDSGGERVVGRLSRAGKRGNRRRRGGAGRGAWEVQRVGSVAGIVPSAVCEGFLGFVGTGMCGWVGRLGGQCRGEVKREGRRAPGAGEMRGQGGVGGVKRIGGDSTGRLGA
ncbi:hypothetical protein ERJ75_001723600 [Trypanosoma vivax]|nr:hypothetical protein ERJ75_001723600 [Trypanosoma vivax]